MSEAHCGTRVRALAERHAELRSRSADLTYELDGSSADDAQQLDVDRIQRDLAALLATDAAGSVKKALLQTLIEDVRVTSRDHIEPTFRCRSRRRFGICPRRWAGQWLIRTWPS